MKEPLSESSTAVLSDMIAKKPIRILHVDDDLSCLKVAQQCLGTQGEFQIETASSVGKAIETMKKEDFDVIVSDFKMPRKDGLEFLKELRERGNDVPFIIFTGKGREEVAIKALNLGADGYFSKSGAPETVYGELAHGICQVVERKRAEEALKESQTKYKSLYQNIPGMIYRARPDWSTEIISNSKNVCGYAIEEFNSGRVNWLDIIHPDDKERVIKEANPIRERPKNTVQEYRIVDKEGKVRWVEDHKTSFFSGEGAFEGVDGVVFDSTERKKAEEALGRSEEKYRSLVENIDDVVFIIDVNGLATYVSPSAERVTGFSPDDIVGKPFLDFFTQAETTRARSNFARMLKGETVKGLEVVIPRKDETQAYYEVNMYPIFLSGKIVGIQGVARDITERKKRSDELKASEERLTILFESAPDGYYLSDLRGNFMDGNKAAEEITGYSKSELIGKSFLKLNLLPNSQIPKAAKLLALNAMGKPTGPDELILNRRDGTQVSVEIRTFPTTIQGQRLVLGIARDITERKKAEEVLRRSSEQARSLLEFQSKIIDTATVWINILDREGNVTLWNRAAELISGYSREEVIGHKKIWEWNYPDPQYRARIFAHQRRTIDHEESTMQNFETVIRCKNGASKTIAWYSNSILDEKGKSVGSIAIGLDVSQLKKAERELRETMEKLQVINEKLRVVGGLTRHDVRNKLAAVTGNAYLARKKLPGNSEVLDYLRQIEASVEQTVRIFDFAKVYEMLGVEQLTYVDLKKAVNEAISLFPDLKGIKIANDCHGLTVLADSLLTQLFYNLVDNSLKYGKKLNRIRVYYEEKHDHMNVIYEDDGGGIPAAEKRKLFSEGYSTGGSTGYGLYLIKKMTEVYGWTIQEMGGPDKGVRFVIKVPETTTNGKENYRILTQ